MPIQTVPIVDGMPIEAIANPCSFFFEDNWDRIRTGDGRVNILYISRGISTTFRIFVECFVLPGWILDTNLRYSTESTTFGSFEVYIDTFFIGSGWLYKSRQAIDTLAPTVGFPVWPYRVAEPTAVINAIRNAGYSIPACPENIWKPDDTLRYAYITFYYRLLGGVQLRFRGVIT